MRLGAVLLAAGLSRRFGGENKLLADFSGRPLICCALDALLGLEAARRVAVVSDERVAALCRARGVETILNPDPVRGQGHSIALGARALGDMDALLLLAADMPRVSAASLRGLADAFGKSGASAACLRDDTHWGNPAIFAAPCFPALCALDGDRGAKAILRAQGGALLRVACAPGDCLGDADTRDALTRLCV